MMYKYGDIVKVKSTGQLGKVVIVDELLEQLEIEFKDGSLWVFKFKHVEPYYNNKLNKIALIGKMRSGKDTVADYLSENYRFKRFAFGDELKRYYHELFGETDSKPRKGYQIFGQKMREINKDIWVNKCFDTIEKYPLDDIVISDLRQPNEYKRCKNEEYIIIKVECDDKLRLKRINQKGDSFTSVDLSHETESHIDTFGYDYLINNNSGLDNLHSQVDEIMSHIGVINEN